jgi:hypothetical protein
MSVTAAPGELARTYEALRAQAVGAIPAGTPRGLALLRRAGVVAWMIACPPAGPVARPTRPAGDAPLTTFAGVGSELVRVLTEMALGSGRRWHT